MCIRDRPGPSGRGGCRTTASVRCDRVSLGSGPRSTSAYPDHLLSHIETVRQPRPSSSPTRVLGAFGRGGVTQPICWLVRWWRNLADLTFIGNCPYVNSEPGPG